MNRTSLFFGVLVFFICATQSAFGFPPQRRQPKIDKKKLVTEIANVRDCDEVWLLKIHDDNGTPDPEHLTVKQQLTPRQREQIPTECGWLDQQLSDLTQAHLIAPELQTVIYIPGWRTTDCSALRQANAVYNAMIKSDELPPIRFVSLVWKAEQSEKRYRQDFIQKSNYSLTVGSAMLPIMQQFQNRDVVLVGHSLGVQVVLSFLTQRNMLPDDGTRYKTAFLGSALNCDFANNIKSQRLSFQCQTSQSLIVNNARDGALRLSSKRVCHPGLGRDAGSLDPVVEQNLVPLGNRQRIEVKSEVGCRHDVAYYVGSQKFAGNMAVLLNTEVLPTANYSN